MAFIESQGSSFYWSTAAATTVITTGAMGLVHQVVAVNGPSGSAGKIDVTNLGSTAKQFLMGLRDEGDISLDVVYDPSSATNGGQVHMFQDRGTRTLRNWMWRVGSTSANIKGWGYCTGFAITGAVDDAVKATMTIAISGPVEASSGLNYSADIPDGSS